MSINPIIDRLARLDVEQLSIDLVMQVLDRPRSFVQDLIWSGTLSALRQAGSGGRNRKGDYKDGSACSRRHQYIITRADVLAYLLKSTTGDKSVLLTVIQARMPKHFMLCKLLCQPQPQAATPPPAETPANVIAFATPAKRPRHKPDPHAGAPELFPELFPSRSA